MQRFATILLAAPHRLAFLTGVVNIVALLLWWALWLAEIHLGLFVLPQGDIPPAVLHGPVMLWFLFPPFIFGFLMTVFPRWMGYPDLTARRFGWTAVGYALASLAMMAGLYLSCTPMLLAGVGLAMLAWIAALVVLGMVLIANHRDGKNTCWHGWSAWAALAFGLAGLAGVALFLCNGDAVALQIALRGGTFAFLLPTFITVAHRMLPFFAGVVVPGYIRWRPDWLLAALWPAFLLMAIFRQTEYIIFQIIISLSLTLLTGLMAFKWWPRSTAPGLVNVLIWGFAWAPVGFAIATIDIMLTTDLSKASDHAIFIGFSSSLLVAMVTRVTHGHSGRQLQMHPVSWGAFIAIQITAISRICAVFMNENPWLLLLAIAIFLSGILPWAVRNGTIYCRPRLDGRPG